MLREMENLSTITAHLMSECRALCRGEDPVDPPDLPRQVEGEWAGQLAQLPPHLLHQLAPPRPLPAHHSIQVLNYG